MGAGLLCGICGYVGPEDPATIVRMRDTMTHRGPDDAGLFQDPQVSLGHRRLLIIDLRSGSQPMSSADGQLVVVFNGEIYNYRILRADLSRRGHAFRTQSDTEESCRPTKRLASAARSSWTGCSASCCTTAAAGGCSGAGPAGQKAAVLHLSARRTRSRTRGLRVRFGTESSAGPSSHRRRPAAVRGAARLVPVERLCAGRTTHLRARPLFGSRRRFRVRVAGSGPAGPRVWKYWDLAFDRAGVQPGGSAEPLADARRRVLQLLRQAVQKRLVADVPVGVLLSGGIDSSAVVAP